MKRRPALWPVLYLAPAALFILAFEYWPLVRSVFLSTQGTDLFGQPSGSVGLENFAAMFAQSAFWHSLTVTLLFTAGTVLVKLGLGLLIALPLSARLRGTSWTRPVVLIPIALSTAVASLIFKTMFQPRIGMLDQTLHALGGPSENGWLTDPGKALASVVAVDAWTGLGLVTLLYLAALDGIGDDVLEAAQLDGAATARLAWSVQLPLIMPTTYFLVITQSIAAMREFTVINILTQGGPSNATRTLVMDIYGLAFGTGTNDYGAAAARGLVLLVIIACLVAFQRFVLERRVQYV